jgi:transglutaminase-like putative cysteine protease
VSSTRRIRLAGTSPGALAFVGAWVVAGMIARLTGTPVVLALMTAMAVAGGVEVVAGRLALRRFAVVSVTTPTVVTAAAPTSVVVELAGTGAVRDGRLLVSVAGSDDLFGATRLGRGAAGDTGVDRIVVVDGAFVTPGVVEAITATIEHAGPLGLVWWRRSSVCAVDPVHVAPPASGPSLGHQRAVSTSDGTEPRTQGRHLGDVDGVRTWREGDPVGAIHWPSSLRAGSLIVHDRTSTSDQRWDVDLDAVVEQAGDRRDSAARLRHTLDEGLRLGHDVSVVTGGERHRVRTDDDAARWSAVVAGRPSAPGDPVPVWRRPLRIVHADETPAPVGAAARWTAAAAAGASLLMLVGALSRSALFVALVVGGLVAGAVVSRRLGDRRPLALRIGIVAAIVAALTLIAVDASGVGGLLEALRGPMPDLLVLLVVLHGFEIVDRRTLRVHHAITFVVAAYAAGLRIDDALIWWIAAWATALLVSIRLTGAAPAPASAVAGPIARPPVGARGRSVGVTAPPSIARLPSTRAVGRTVAWLAGSAIATLAVLSVVPIPDGPARLGLPAFSADDTPVTSPGALAAPGGAVTDADTGGDRGRIGEVVGYPGFTDTLDTTIRGDLGDEVVMRVRAPEPAFWRGQTFRDFDGRAWTASRETGRRQDGPTITVAPTLGDAAADDVATEQFVQTYFVETDLPNVVFAAARPTEVIFDGAVWTRPDGALRSDVTLAPGSVYTVVSERAQVTAEMLRAQGDLGEFFGRFAGQPGAEELDAFLEVPASTTARTIELATRLRQDTTYDTILAYERWLAANTSYDLDAPVPPPGADAVDDFLFESRLGYCEQIASTLAVMLRSQGVPARLATGYVPGERDRVSGVWKVLASDAHAWVEVWFPRTGWQAFDPTAGVPLAGDAEVGTVGGDLLGAVGTTVTEHRGLLAVLAVAVGGAWALVAAALRWRERRRRGRWGVLQDRFDLLTEPEERTDRGLTNPERASHLEPRDVATAVAETLDRAAFDPGWIDDDETYERTRAAVATLERHPR